MEVNSHTSIGLCFTGLGVFFIFLGVVLLFDKGLLAIGNILFLVGLTFLIGFMRTLSFFFQRQKWKGSLAFFCGIFVLLLGHPIIGIMIEFCGAYLLFKSLGSSAFSHLLSFLPFFSAVKNRSIV